MSTRGQLWVQSSYSILHYNYNWNTRAISFFYYFSLFLYLLLSCLCHDCVVSCFSVECSLLFLSSHPPCCIYQVSIANHLLSCLPFLLLMILTCVSPLVPHGIKLLWGYYTESNYLSILNVKSMFLVAAEWLHFSYNSSDVISVFLKALLLL